MAKSNRKPKILEVVEDRAEQLAIAEIDQQIALPKSVVLPTYKVRYKLRALDAGLKGKAAKRSNGDWLAETVKKLVLNEKEKLVIERLEAICEANGLPNIQTRWPNKNKGWEGRLRMTSCIVLRKLVADNEILHTPEGDLVPPAAFVARNRTI